jgi:hypothetical protein
MAQDEQCERTAANSVTNAGIVDRFHNAGRIAAV